MKSKKREPATVDMNDYIMRKNRQGYSVLLGHAENGDEIWAHPERAITEEVLASPLWQIIPKDTRFKP